MTEIKSDPRWINDSNEGVKKDAAYWAGVDAAAYASMAKRGLKPDDLPNAEERKRYAAYLAAQAK
jgi:hypothetical protein